MLDLRFGSDPNCPKSSIRGEVNKKHFTFGRIFVDFSPLGIEQDCSRIPLQRLGTRTLRLSTSSLPASPPAAALRATPNTALTVLAASKCGGTRPQDAHASTAPAIPRD